MITVYYSSPQPDKETVANYLIPQPTAMLDSVVPHFYPMPQPARKKEKKIVNRAKTPSEAAAMKLKSVTLKVETGYYRDVHELISTINNTGNMLLYAAFSYDDSSGMVSLKINDNRVHQIMLSTGLALQLGFDPQEEDLVGRLKSRRPADIHASIPSHMYVYCDLVEPQLVGDTAAPLLKIVNIDTKNYKYGGNNIVHFNDPHYAPVMKSAFESVEVDLRDSVGRRLPFRFGTSCVKLHLRRAS
jgi:hypothetical protein